MADVHQEKAVRLCTGRSVTDLLGWEGRVTAVLLDDDTLLHADVVVVAIGSVPAVDWLADSGLRSVTGCSATAPARSHRDLRGRRRRQLAASPHRQRTRPEQRTNATQQAITAARNLLAGPAGATPYTPVPFGWTDQYDARIQFHGWAPAHARIEYVDGDPRAGKSSRSTAPATAASSAPSAGTAHVPCGNTAATSPRTLPPDRSPSPTERWETDDHHVMKPGGRIRRPAS